MKHLISVCFIALGAIVFSQASLSQTTTNACLDSDGDGWGWNGSESCQVECIDTDGDGWGWNGFYSCQVSSACVDTDGDGWGWDGYRSCRTECVDSDGDGWGWNGYESCRIEITTESEEESNTVDAERTVFQNDLIGYRLGECIDLEPDSYRLLDAYTPDYNIEDYFYYRDSTACEGLPIGLSFPLQVYTYTIGDKVEGVDGRTGWDIEFESVQRGGDDFGFFGEDFGVAAGDSFTTATTVENGLVLYADDENIFPTDSSDEVATPFGDDTLSVNALVESTWTSNCVLRDPGSAQDTRDFTETGETFIRTVYFSDDCSGETDYAYQLNSNIQYDEQLSRTIFGGYILGYREEIVSTEFLQGNPPLDVQEDVANFAGRVKYVGVALVGDTLVSGHCLFNDGCEQTADRSSDRLDLGWSYRWSR